MVVVVGSLGVVVEVAVVTVVEVAVVTVVVGVGAGEEGDERRVITPWHAANSVLLCSLTVILKSATLSKAVGPFDGEKTTRHWYNPVCCVRRVSNSMVTLSMSPWASSVTVMFEVFTTLELL